MHKHKYCEGRFDIAVGECDFNRLSGAESMHSFISLTRDDYGIKWHPVRGLMTFFTGKLVVAGLMDACLLMSSVLTASDYVVISQEITFEPADSEFNLVVHTLQDDIIEPEEFFQVVLRALSDRVRLGQQTAGISIIDLRKPIQHTCKHSVM